MGRRFENFAAKRAPKRGCHAVIASANDPAWTGALALAAGHGQPLVWVSAPAADPGANLPMDQAMALSGQITALLTSLGWKFDALGDEIDALTLALNLPVRVEYAPPPQPLAPSRLGPFVPKPGEALALADVIGRETGRARMARWAWCAHTPGNEAEAAYRAMSALFLRPRSALLFDGYESNEPWVRYDMTAAAKLLTAAGLAVDMWDTPRQGLGDWQKMASRPVNAGLFMLNSHGQHWNFNLTPGQGRVGDVPVFGTPAAVSVVHSWSAWSPANAATVAGRFLLHGAFAYVGSVHEPFLQAFVPTPQLTARLASGLPLAAAARVEDGPPWRITVIGDALFNLGPDAPRAEAPLPLAGAADLRAEVPEKGVAPEIIWSLVMLGDDRAALLRFSAGPDAAKESGAAAAAMAAFRLGDGDAQWQATRQARALADSFPSMRDALWLALRPRFRALPRERVALLAAMIRPEQPGRDAGEVYDMIARTDGKPAALAVLKKLREQAATDTARTELDQLIQANTPRP
ncbi:MAG: hypothetical protein KIT68_01505 [Phycisphaeraceae bacterium]|nr:hypothetical protein [Phycisphaeraceae bacterium]